MWLRGVFSGPPQYRCCGEMGGDTIVLYDGSMDPTIKAGSGAASVPWSTCSQELASCMGESQQEDDTPEADPLQLLPIEQMDAWSVGPIMLFNRFVAPHRSLRCLGIL